MSATSSRNSDLRAYILELIRQRGKLSFAEFMNEALYSQRGGYYRHVVPGTDYYTAPLAHPAFGTLLTLWMLKLNSTLGQNAEPQIVEIGAANGIMARNGVQYARQHKPEIELNYRAYDLSPPATPHYPVATLDQLPHAVTGCLITNELLDAMPVRRYVVRDSQPLEIFVTEHDGELVETELPLDLDQLTPYWRERIAESPDGTRGTINTGLDDWTALIKRTLTRGYVITIDYGKPRGGDIRVFSKHGGGLSPYDNIGERDITADVDFAEFEQAMDTAGLQQVLKLTQGELLRELGLRDWERQIRRLGLPQREHTANMAAMRRLSDPDGMGGFRVYLHSYALESSPTMEDIRVSFGDLPPPLMADYPGHPYPQDAWS